MRFLVDSPLGGLAKWLRFSGFDTELRPLARIPPGDLPPPSPGLYLLTRQKSLAKLQRHDILVLTAAEPEAQLKEVFQRLGISRRDLDPLSRCVRCNVPLQPVAREAVAGRVPEHVFHTHEEFYECPACHRLYWPGSHIRGISRKLAQALKRPGKGISSKTITRTRSIA